MTSPPRRRVDFPTLGSRSSSRTSGGSSISGAPSGSRSVRTLPQRWHGRRTRTGRAAGTTARGDLAVKSVWWVDGWWGQADMGMDDTAAEGHAVILTAAGFTDASTAIGEITTHFELTRDAQDDRDGTVSVTATRIHNLRASTRDTR